MSSKKIRCGIWELISGEDSMKKKRLRFLQEAHFFDRESREYQNFDHLSIENRQVFRKE